MRAEKGIFTAEYAEVAEGEEGGKQKKQGKNSCFRFR